MSSNAAVVRDAEIQKAKIHRSAEMSAAQATTDAYAQISETVLTAERANKVRYVVEEDGTNAIDAKLMGRIKDDAGNWSAWVDAGGANASTSALNGAAAELYPSEVVFDQYAVYIKADVGGSQGNVTAYGKTFFVAE